MLIDFEPELGVGCQIGRAALSMAYVTIDPVVPATNPPTWLVSLVTPVKILSKTFQDHALAEATYGKLVNKVNGGTPFQAGPVEALDPAKAAEIRAVAMMAFGMAAVIVRGPNSQAYIAKWLMAIEDPVIWAQMLALVP